MDIGRLTDYSFDEEPNYFDIRTERLDPIVSSSFRYQFRLDPASFMDRNSMLLFKVNASSAVEAAKKLRLNCFNGALGAVKSIELQIGDHQVQRIENVNEWATLNRLYSLPVAVQDKLFAHYAKNQLKFKVRETSGTNDADLVGVIEPNNDKSGVDYGNTLSGAGADVNSLQLSDSASNNQLVGIPLGVLCPMLANQDFPLFLFQEYKIHLTIEFESDASRYVNDMSQNDYAGANTQNLQADASAVSISDVHLLVDYLIFPARVVDRIKAQTQKQGGYNFEFINVETVQKTLNAGTANVSQQEEFRLNVVGQEVHYVEMIKRFSDYSQKGFDKVVLKQGCNSVSIQEYQFNVNGIDKYTEGFVFSPLEMYNNITYVLGKDLSVPKPLCVGDTNTEASMLSPPQQGLLGQYAPICIDLRTGQPTIRGGGTPINDYPIRHIYKRKPHNEITCANIANTPICGRDEVGNMDINYFLGVSRVVNVLAMPSGGNNVIVSDL